VICLLYLTSASPGQLYPSYAVLGVFISRIQDQSPSFSPSVLFFSPRPHARRSRSFPDFFFFPAPIEFEPPPPARFSRKANGNSVPVPPPRAQESVQFAAFCRRDTLSVPPGCPHFRAGRLSFTPCSGRFLNRPFHSPSPGQDSSFRRINFGLMGPPPFVLFSPRFISFPAEPSLHTSRMVSLSRTFQLRLQDCVL